MIFGFCYYVFMKRLKDLVGVGITLSIGFLILKAIFDDFGCFSAAVLATLYMAGIFYGAGFISNLIDPDDQKPALSIIIFMALLIIPPFVLDFASIYDNLCPY